MLKFFRQIRQQNLNQGQMKKYTLYAIGEILLVVIGILIALQINNWNEGRKDRQLEVKYLTNLKNELNGNTKRTKRLILDRYEGKMEGLQLAKSYVEGDYKVQDTSGFILKVSYGAVFSNGIEFLNTNTFDELSSTGNLQLIRNETLKESIHGHYRFIKSQKVNVRFYMSDYLKMINSQRVFDEDNPNKFSPYEQKSMLKKLKTEEAYENTNLEITYAKRVISLMREFETRSHDLIRLIDEEINNQ